MYHPRPRSGRTIEEKTSRKEEDKRRRAVRWARQKYVFFFWSDNTTNRAGTNPFSMHDVKRAPRILVPPTNPTKVARPADSSVGEGASSPHASSSPAAIPQRAVLAGRSASKTEMGWRDVWGEVSRQDSNCTLRKNIPVRQYARACFAQRRWLVCVSLAVSWRRPRLLGFLFSAGQPLPGAFFVPQREGKQTRPWPLISYCPPIRRHRDLSLRLRRTRTLRVRLREGC